MPNHISTFQSPTKTKENCSATANFFTLLLIFKSTLGICYLNYHYPIAKCGFLIAMILNVITFYLTTYALYKITRLADLIEKKAQEEEGNKTMIRVYHEFPEIMKTPGAQ
jgi:hypothetical protein